MIKACLKKLKEGQAKLVTTDTPYYTKVCNSIDTYVVDEMLNELETGNLNYGWYKTTEEPLKTRDWLLLHTARDGSNLANTNQNKIHKFVENGEEKFAVSGSYGVYFYDKHFNYLKAWRDKSNIRAVYVDIDNDTFIAVSEFWIWAVKYSTLELLWTFGTGNRGELKDNKLNYVKDVAKLPNGNYAFVEYYGKGYDKDNDKYLTTKSEGVVFELDSNGNYVQTLLYRGDNSYYPEQGFIRYPRSIEIINNKLFVSTYMNEIAVFELDSDNTATYITNYTPPPEFGITFDIVINDFYINGDTLIVLSEALKQVIGFDINERNIVWVAGQASVENLATTPAKLNGIYAPKGVTVRSEDGAIIVSDDFNDMVKIIYPNIYKDVEYALPEFNEMIYSSEPYVGNNKFKVKLDNYPDVFLVYKGSAEQEA